MIYRKSNNGTISESGDLMPLFAWIIDEDREAVFTFMTYNQPWNWRCVPNHRQTQ